MGSNCQVKGKINRVTQEMCTIETHLCKGRSSAAPKHQTESSSNSKGSLLTYLCILSPRTANAQIISAQNAQEI